MNPAASRPVVKPRGISKRNALKQVCDRGHPFDAANTFHWVDARGYQHRQCRACNRIRVARRRREARR
jgi:hypothetical protein